MQKHSGWTARKAVRDRTIFATQALSPRQRRPMRGERRTATSKIDGPPQSGQPQRRRAAARVPPHARVRLLRHPEPVGPWQRCAPRPARFPALASTSAGFAWSHGRAGHPRDAGEALDHLRASAGRRRRSDQRRFRRRVRGRARRASRGTRRSRRRRASPRSRSRTRPATRRAALFALLSVGRAHPRGARRRSTSPRSGRRARRTRSEGFIAAGRISRRRSGG